MSWLMPCAVGAEVEAWASLHVKNSPYGSYQSRNLRRVTLTLSSVSTLRNTNGLLCIYGTVRCPAEDHRCQMSRIISIVIPVMGGRVIAVTWYSCREGWPDLRLPKDQKLPGVRCVGCACGEWGLRVWELCGPRALAMVSELCE